ncbi:MAG: hypothetical protein EA384_08425 [Spirochaetaceae bacterium]|nr:MAG: hypothetical protein EA384_08425 [Spirochaetaceae bacterium]
MALFLVGLALFSACGDGGLVMPSLPDHGEVGLQTVADGAVVTYGERIDASLQAGPDERAPDRIEVTFRDAAGEVAASRTIVAAEIDRSRLPPLAIDELPTGYYTLRFELFRDGRRIGDHQRRLFISTAPFAVAGISAYPPTFMTDSRGILRADLNLPPQADPYIRWSFNGRPISRGLLSAGAGELLLRSPAAEGVYSVELELFPEAPRDADWGFASQVLQRTDLVVKESPGSADRGFGPPESYYVLLHFAGNTRDSGMRTKLLGGQAAEARESGEVDLRIAHDLFGYYLDGSSGIEFNEVIVPYRAGGFAPFSVALRLVLTEPQSDRVLFQSESADSSFGLQLLLAGEGELQARLYAGELMTAVTTSGAGVRAGRPFDVNLSLVPRVTDTVLELFVDGEPASGADTALRLPQPAEGVDGQWQRLAGHSVIGGRNGFAGVIDEFGVFFRDERNRPAANTAPFRAAQVRRYGDALIFAEGFESGRLPAALATRGTVRVGKGGVFLDPKGVLVGPQFAHDIGAVTLELSVAADREATYRIDVRSVADGALMLSRHRRGTETVVLHLDRSHEGLTFVIPEHEEYEIALPVGFSAARLEIVNDSAEREVAVESLLAYLGTRQVRQSMNVP